MPDEKPEAAATDAEAEKAATTAASDAPAPAPEKATAAETAPEPSSAPPEGASEASGEASGKRKKVEEPELRPALGPDGRERPAFLLGFPTDPELERLMRAFELGNYALVRTGAPELAQRTTDAKVRAAAEELGRRIEPDPLMKILLGLSITLLVVLTFWAYKTHGN